MNARKLQPFMTLQSCTESAIRTALGGVLAAAFVVSSAVVIAGCANEHPPPPAKTADVHRVREAEPDRLETTPAHRARVGHGADLYVPPWFHPQAGGYDLIVHFHGLRELQEKNIEQARLNVAVVSINLGVGTDPYAAAFRDRKAFEKLLEETDGELGRSGRSGGAKLRRLALSAWSAGFVSVQRVLAHRDLADRVDAVLLADGFFTSYSNLEKKTINTGSLAPFVDLAGAATRREKLFVITHTAIPTVGYPSVTDTVGKLLEMSALERTPSSEVGPKQMKLTYVVDKGDLHVHGYAGVTAADHVNQLRAAGETLYPYLHDRWAGEGANANASAERRAAATTPTSTTPSR